MKIAIGYLIVLGILLTYGTLHEHRNNSHVLQKTQNIISATITEKKVDPRALQVYYFLKKYDSPLQNNAYDFIDASDKYKVPYKVLVAIAGVESGFGKHTPSCAYYNSFGYSSTTSPCGWYRFQSYRESIYKVAETISRGSAYKRYQQSGSILELAKVYTANAEDWTQKVQWFIKLI